MRIKILFTYTYQIARIFTIAILITACDSKTTYYNYQHTNIDGWQKNEKLHFQIPPVDNPGNYRQYIGIRFTDYYPFQTLSLIVKQTIYPQNKTFSDTISYEVIDEQGRLIGKGLNISQFETPIKTLSLKQGDSIAITIQHHMRRNLIQGISDIGIKMERTE